MLYIPSATPSTTAYHIGHTERQKFTTCTHTHTHAQRDSCYTPTLVQLEFILHERSQTEVAVAQKGMKSIEQKKYVAPKKKELKLK